jgi:Flp pilus assembly pilin Flp
LIPRRPKREEDFIVRQLLHRFYFLDDGQDVAEYAIMLGVILFIVIGTVKLIGANANNVFSGVAAKIGS